MVHAWLDGALPPDEAARIARLVRDDPAWAAAAAEARGLIANASRLLRALDDAPVAGGAMPRALDGGAPPVPSAGRPWGRRLAAIAAVLLVAVVGRQAVREDATTSQEASQATAAPPAVPAVPAVAAPPAPTVTKASSNVLDKASARRQAFRASEAAAPDADRATPSALSAAEAQAEVPAPAKAAESAPAAARAPMAAVEAGLRACQRVEVTWYATGTARYDGAMTTMRRADDSVMVTMPLAEGELRATVGGAARSGPAQLVSRDGAVVWRGAVVGVMPCPAPPPRD